MEATHDDAATRPETLQDTEHAPVPPSLWRSVLHAFRQARLARLEARLQRVRQYASCPSTSREQPVILVPTERVPQHEDAAWPPLTTARPPRRLWIIVTVGLLTLTGISLSAFLLRSRVMTAEALPPPPESPMTSVARETIELRTLLARLDDRVTVLQHQVMQHGDHLTNQTATVLRVSQHADTQETQLATLADMVTALTAQVAYVEQQVMTQATRLTTQDKQLATQAVQLGTVRERTRDIGDASQIAAPGRSSRPRPPTLEVFAPPPVQPITPVPSPTSGVPAAGTPPVRRSITLPASLGAVGFRGANSATGGPQP